MESQILIHPDELSHEWVDRARVNGIDVIGIHPVGGYKACQSLKDLVDKFVDHKFTKLIDYALNNNVKIEYEMHAASYLMPRELFDTHPEYFRIDETGKRNSDKNFCVSNSEALSIVSKAAVELVSKLYKSTDRYYFWMDDVKNKKCMCEKCKDLSMSDQQMVYLNTILKQIQKNNPDAKMAYLAYFDCIEPPEKIKPISGVFFEYAPMEKYTLSTEDQLITGIDEALNIPKLFSVFGKRNSKVLEYWLDNSMFSDWKKPEKKFVPDEVMIREDIDKYHTLGFEYISSFACYLGSEYVKLYGKPDISPFYNSINSYKE
ncbi:MAG: DUF4838 domain-containing protein [Clostridiaceae bacterium]|nr:DUF4838 domain-containing protein [Clostridiaceae bacterium]